MATLTKSIEDYLETIFLLEKESSSVKSVDIANHLNVSKPGVNKAMNILISMNYIQKPDYGNVTLTDEGRKVASSIYQRHCILKNFLLYIGVDEKTADEDCCKLEHVVSDITLKKLEEFTNKK